MWMKFFHILFVLWFAGGVVGMPVVRALLKRTEQLEARVFAVRLLYRLHLLLVLPGLLGGGVIGFGLVSMSGYGFGPGWVHLSIVLYLLLLLLNLAYVTPQLRKRTGAANASIEVGRATEAFEALLSEKIFGKLTDLNAVGLVLLSLLMTVKPV